MIISFSVFRDKIESGEKKQTIRKYSEKRYKQFCNAKKYQLYWGNPRNGGTLIKVVEPADKPFLIAFNNSDTLSNIDVLGETKDRFHSGCWDLYDFAKKDGFETSRDLFDWFYEHYGKDMYQTKFMVIRWK